MTQLDAHDRRKGMPSPDDPRKPQEPRQLQRRSWKYIATRAVKEFGQDQCTDAAAALTYYGVLSAFPALLAVFSLLGVVGQGKEAARQLLGIVTELAPGSTAELVRDPINRFASSSTAGFALAVGIVLAVWTASGYVGAFTRAMNRIYEIDEGRPVWVLRPVQFAITLALIVLVSLVVVLLVVSGPVTDAVGDALRLGSVATTAWAIVKWPVMAAAVVIAVALLYWGTPNVRQPRLRWISLGGLIAMAGLAIATLGFGFYVGTFANYDKSYGSLAGVIVFLVWLYIANLVLLFGAEFDSEVERARELQADMPAEERLQLPPRGTRQSEKQARQRRELSEQAHELRPPHREESGSRDHQRRGFWGLGWLKRKRES